ncbi:MAG: hypothetical protein R2856_19880 [Caldilineaceae bacterium]
MGTADAVLDAAQAAQAALQLSPDPLVTGRAPRRPSPHRHQPRRRHRHWHRSRSAHRLGTTL